MKRLFLLILTLIIAGCGAVPLQSRSLEVALDVPLLTVNLGGGSKVFLKVVDERPERSADRSITYEAVAPIFPHGDFAFALRETLGTRLAALGYEVLSTEDPTAARLNVAVRTLSYGRYSTKPQQLHIDASLLSTVHKDETCRMERAYFREYTQLGKAADMKQTWFEEKTNRLLSELVEKMLADMELHAALQSKLQTNEAALSLLRNCSAASHAISREIPRLSVWHRLCSVALTAMAHGSGL